MNLLFEHFETLIDAPNGIKKMRELILQLAVRGKLVPQDPNDEPASELLKRVKAEKEKLIKEGKIKKEKPLQPISEKEIPYELPEGWVWCKLREILSKIHYGYTASGDTTYNQYKFLRITDIQDNFVNWANVPGCEISDTEAKKYLLNENDILIARTGGTIGKSYLVTKVDVPSVFASYLIRIIPSKEMRATYLKYFLESPLYWIQLTKSSMGTGQPNVNGTALSNLKIPCPPINEQKRTADKVDQLLALCDELEKQKEKQDQKRIHFNNASLNKLLTSKTPAEFQTNWQRITDNFDILYEVPESVAELKTAILQLAVMSKLVPQDPNDEPASILLKRIKAEKEKLIKEGKIKKEKNLPPILEEEIPYTLPEGWVWCRLRNLGLTQTGTTPPKDNPEHFGNDYPFIKPADISDNHVNYLNEGLSESGIEKGRFIKAGSVLMVCIGGSIGKVNYIDRDVSCNQQINTITPLQDQPYKYINFVCRSPYFKKKF